MYGEKQSIVSAILMQGNNQVSVNTANLNAGAYFLRITTVYGSESRMFFKE